VNSTAGDKLTREGIDKLWSNPQHGSSPIYNCPDDPRIIVPLGIRWTGAGLNLAHKAAIPVLILMLAALLSPFLFLLALEHPEGGGRGRASFIAVTLLLCFLVHWGANRQR